MARQARFYLMLLILSAVFLAMLPSIFFSRPAWETYSDDNGIVLLLAFAGDIMVHQEQIDAAYNPDDNSYNFTGCFEPVKPLLEQADLAFCNLEVVLAGEESGYTGYPAFNAPESLALALKENGFDVVSTVNNHSLDRGEEGIYRTLDHLEQAGLHSFGTYRTREEREMPLVLDVKGVKIAFTGYTYGTNEIPLPEGKEYLVNLLDKELIMRDLKKAGELADLVILYLHWGNEYHRYPSREQVAMAEEFLQAGADMIIGSHPHVIQPVEFIKAGSEKLVAYSLGNFISDQRLHYTDTGMILYVRIVVNRLSGSSELLDVSFVPTWVHKYHTYTGLNFRVLPVPEAIASYRKGKDPLLDASAYNRMQKVLEESRNHLQFLPLWSND